MTLRLLLDMGDVRKMSYQLDRLQTHKLCASELKFAKEDHDTDSKYEWLIMSLRHLLTDNSKVILVGDIEIADLLLLLISDWSPFHAGQPLLALFVDMVQGEHVDRTKNHSQSSESKVDANAKEVARCVLSFEDLSNNHARTVSHAEDKPKGSGAFEMPSEVAVEPDNSKTCLERS